MRAPAGLVVVLDESARNLHPDPARFGTVHPYLVSIGEHEGLTEIVLSRHGWNKELRHNLSYGIIMG